MSREARVMMRPTTRALMDVRGIDWMHGEPRVRARTARLLGHGHSIVDMVPPDLLARSSRDVIVSCGSTDMACGLWDWRWRSQVKSWQRESGKGARPRCRCHRTARWAHVSLGEMVRCRDGRSRCRDGRSRCRDGRYAPTLIIVLDGEGDIVPVPARIHVHTK